MVRKVLSILGQLSDADVEWIVRHGHQFHCAVGQTLIHAGQRPSMLYFLLEGAVAVTLPNGAELARLGVGEILGEMSLVDKQAPTASVTATQATIFLAVEQERLHAKMEQDASFAAHMYRAIACFLSMRMRSTISNLGFGKAEQTLEDEIELDEEILDKLHLAGVRFERMLSVLR
ncbi:cyclic nucleotide-binding domain-containing protein [Duganella sp. sic0402]|uniref:cyclic nucleotide-binding domain-containing protein n=1 Tax=Duganella sp. sic0402 TaxID=2854786 RepID=UPI001C441FE8|nr:cyclic nucleotide-binding domain-containing protein [Duganella sp. sic0402]MBV7539435.1 cyclic nucleotide-binding domain-containing protein [Duganella sp. sic0402]